MTRKMTKQAVQAMLTSMVLATFAYGLSVSAATYTVKAGDTLSQIAFDHQTSVDELAKLNKLSNVNLILAGQTLELSAHIKKKTEPTPAPAAPTPAQTAPAEAVVAQPYQSNLTASDAEAKEIIAFKESSGSYTAQNGQYYGRYQLSLSYLNGDLSPENQERVADEYVRNRYGSWSAALGFWQANGWY